MYAIKPFNLSASDSAQCRFSDVFSKSELNAKVSQLLSGIQKNVLESFCGDYNHEIQKLAVVGYYIECNQLYLVHEVELIDPDFNIIELMDNGIDSYTEVSSQVRVLEIDPRTRLTSEYVDYFLTGQQGSFVTSEQLHFVSI